MIIIILHTLLQRKFGKFYKANMTPKRLVQRNMRLVVSFAINWWIANLLWNRFKTFK